MPFVWSPWDDDTITSDEYENNYDWCGDIDYIVPTTVYPSTLSIRTCTHTPKYPTKTQRKMPKSKSTRRVSFNKVVGVNRGMPKKLKRVNATKIAYAVLGKRGPIDSEFMKSLVKKHKQRGSTRKAIRESIQTLHDLDMRVCNGTSHITTIGAKYILNSDILHTIDWSSRLSQAKTVLKEI